MDAGRARALPLSALQPIDVSLERVVSQYIFKARVNIFLQGMKKTRADAKKIGPLKLAALNGLSLSRLPLPDEGKEVSTRATNDERVSVCWGPASCFLGVSMKATPKCPRAVLANFFSELIFNSHK